jgi:hypothetical protein
MVRELLWLVRGIVIGISGEGERDSLEWLLAKAVLEGTTVGITITVETFGMGGSEEVAVVAFNMFEEDHVGKPPPPS